MTPYVSDPRNLALHGARVLGFASTTRIASRYGVDIDTVDQSLQDFEAHGWVRHTSFAGDSGWSLTESGRTENELRLAAELDAAGARTTVRRVHAEFVPLNQRFTTACTNWQIRPTRADPVARNDHTDWRWDERVLRTLTSLERTIGELCNRLAACLRRFDGYADRYSAALARVNAGQRRWIDDPEVDSCHTVWIQLHEDLLATLGLPRGTDT